MRNFTSKFIDPLLSMYRGPYVYNMAGEGDGGTTATQTSTTGEEGQDDGAIDESTPAGKKFAEMRKRAQDAETKATEATRKAEIAEAEKKAYSEALEKVQQKKAGGQQKKSDTNEDEDIPINPKDEKYVLKILRQQGIDVDSLKELPKLKESMESNAQMTQRNTAEQQVNAACEKIEKKYADSVPFDREAAIKYAVDQKLGINVPGASLEDVLSLAHERMNEEKILDWKIEQRKKKLKSPPLQNSGTGKKELREEKPTSTMGYRKLAKDMVGAND